MGSSLVSSSQSHLNAESDSGFDLLRIKPKFQTFKQTNAGNYKGVLGRKRRTEFSEITLMKRQFPFLPGKVCLGEHNGDILVSLPCHGTRVYD